MAPRRGRGRGKMRARPPQVIRNSIAELSNYDAAVKAALQNNLDAARAYFPPLAKRVCAPAAPPLPSEIKLLQEHASFRDTMLNSPAAIHLPAVSTQTPLRTQLQSVADFFRTPAASAVQRTAPDLLWRWDACWIVPDVLPPELLPASLRNCARPRKKARTEVREQQTDLTSQQMLDNFRLQEADNAANEPDANQPADDEQQELEPGAVEQQDDDEDVDHIADYQTGVHFDDDDGYEEVESGDDAEPIVAF
ncbi:DNA-directed RNA polymerase 3 subunit Rpc31 [Gracilaria domingensis]|nr:DNA-directed RNA polymerase 3 subunit Rpc31 [Gracilaria domingensis]